VRAPRTDACVLAFDPEVVLRWDRLPLRAIHQNGCTALAHHLYNLLDQDSQPDDLAAAAIDLALAETRDAHQAVWDGLGRVERILPLALADGQAPTGSRVADEHRIARSTLQDALGRLLADERNLRRDRRDRPFVLDPLLGEWLRRR
jgi:hypothetical protein